MKICWFLITFLLPTVWVSSDVAMLQWVNNDEPENGFKNMSFIPTLSEIQKKIVFLAVLFSASVCLRFSFFQFIFNSRSIQLFFWWFSCLWLKWEFSFLSSFFFLPFLKHNHHRGQISQKTFSFFFFSAVFWNPPVLFVFFSGWKTKPDWKTVLHSAARYQGEIKSWLNLFLAIEKRRRNKRVLIKWLKTF